jgi:hypothetical protein
MAMYGQKKDTTSRSIPSTQGTNVKTWECRRPMHRQSHLVHFFDDQNVPPDSFHFL